jgi:hypothetical protein
MLKTYREHVTRLSPSEHLRNDPTETACSSSAVAEGAEGGGRSAVCTARDIEPLKSDVTRFA